MPFPNSFLTEDSQFYCVAWEPFWGDALISSDGSGHVCTGRLSASKIPFRAPLALLLNRRTVKAEMAMNIKTNSARSHLGSYKKHSNQVIDP